MSFQITKLHVGIALSCLMTITYLQVNDHFEKIRQAELAEQRQIELAKQQAEYERKQVEAAKRLKTIMECDDLIKEYHEFKNASLPEFAEERVQWFKEKNCESFGKNILFKIY